MSTFKVTDLLVEKILFEFQTTNSFLSPDVGNRDYVEYFDHKKNGGYFTGDSVRGRLPNLYIPSQGWTVTAQPVTEREFILPLQEPINVGVSFVSNEAQTYIDLGDQSYIDRVAQPAGRGIIAKANALVAAAYLPKVYNYVGDATADLTTLTPFWQAGAMLNGLGGVNNISYIYDTFCALHPYAQATLGPEVLKLYLPKTNEEVFKTGRFITTNGIEVLVENAVQIQQSYKEAKDMASLTVKTTVASGSAIVLTGAPSSTLCIKAGDVFSIAAVKKVNPYTKAALPWSGQFVATADATSVGADVTVQVQPFSCTTTDQYQNLHSATGNIPATSPVTWVGSHVANIVWMKPMLTFVAPPVPALSEGATSVIKTDPDTKVWIRYSAQDLISTSTHNRRIDLRPGIYWDGTLAVRILSKIPA